MNRLAAVRRGLLRFWTVRFAAAVVVLLSAAQQEHAPSALVMLTAGEGCRPDNVLNLRAWKLTLPTGGNESPTEILPSTLGALLPTRWFQPTADCEGMVFRAPVTGTTTKGSRYPRSELREMTSTGTKAAWSSADGVHWMAVTTAFTVLPQGKPELVAAQIHDASDDVTVFRLEGDRLYVTDGDNPHYRLIDDNYHLGTVFNAGFLVTPRAIGAYYNDRLVAALQRPVTDGYFKAGAYTQANCSNAPCRADNFGETIIYDLQVGHP